VNFRSAPWARVLFTAPARSTIQASACRQLPSPKSKKSISDSRSVENISDKILRIEVQPAQTNGVETAKRFVNVLLHCIISNLRKESKISFNVAPPGKISADAHG